MLRQLREDTQLMTHTRPKDRHGFRDAIQSAKDHCGQQMMEIADFHMARDPWSLKVESTRILKTRVGGELNQFSCRVREEMTVSVGCILTVCILSRISNARVVREIVFEIGMIRSKKDPRPK